MDRERKERENEIARERKERENEIARERMEIENDIARERMERENEIRKMKEELDRERKDNADLRDKLYRASLTQVNKFHFPNTLSPLPPLLSF